MFSLKIPGITSYQNRKKTTQKKSSARACRGSIIVPSAQKGCLTVARRPCHPLHKLLLSPDVFFSNRARAQQAGYWMTRMMMWKCGGSVVPARGRKRDHVTAGGASCPSDTVSRPFSLLLCTCLNPRARGAARCSPTGGHCGM